MKKLFAVTVVLVIALTLVIVSLDGVGQAASQPLDPQPAKALVIVSPVEMEQAASQPLDLDPAEALVAALFLATVANRLVEGLITPIFTKFAWDKFWLTYIAWAVGGLLVGLSGINLFAAYLPDPLTGQILSALIAGGGANLLHDLFQPAPART